MLISHDFSIDDQDPLPEHAESPSPQPPAPEPVIIVRYRDRPSTAWLLGPILIFALAMVILSYRAQPPDWLIQRLDEPVAAPAQTDRLPESERNQSPLVLRILPEPKSERETEKAISDSPASEPEQDPEDLAKSRDC